VLRVPSHFPSRGDDEDEKETLDMTLISARECPFSEVIKMVIRKISTYPPPVLILFLVFLLLPKSSLSDAPSSGEILINETLENDQSQADIAINSDDEIIVAWHSFSDSGQGFDIFCRIFDMEGNPITSEILVNSVVALDQIYPRIGVRLDGEFVIVWASDGGDGDGYGVMARRFASDGAPVTGEFHVNTYTQGAQAMPAVARNDQGDFVVVWESYGQAGQDASIFGRLFDQDGNPVGSEFQVNTYITKEQSAPDVAMDSDGNFVAVWQSLDQDFSGYGIFYQRFDSLGQPDGMETRANAYFTYEQSWPSIGMNHTGEYLIAWQSVLQDSYGFGIFANLFDTSGNFLYTVEPVVNSETYEDQYYVNVGADGDGNFILAWQSRKQDGDGTGIFAQRFSDNDLFTGGEIGVNVYRKDTQKFTAAAISPSGGLVIAWQSEESDWENDHDIIARIFSPCDTDPECDDGLFCNGLEYCDDKICVSDPAPCDDGLFCTGLEICEESDDSCHKGDYPCGEEESCDEVFDTCQDDDDDDDNDTHDDDDDDNDDNNHENDDDDNDDDDSIGNQIGAEDKNDSPCCGE